MAVVVQKIIKIFLSSEVLVDRILAAVCPGKLLAKIQSIDVLISV